MLHGVGKFGTRILVGSLSFQTLNRIYILTSDFANRYSIPDQVALTLSNCFSIDVPKMLKVVCPLHKAAV